jgi:hypothetical protein
MRDWASFAWCPTGSDIPTAALFWPNKFVPLFEILLFPWGASSRAIRANGIAAIGLASLLLVTRVSGNR